MAYGVWTLSVVGVFAYGQHRLSALVRLDTKNRNFILSALGRLNTVGVSTTKTVDRSNQLLIYVSIKICIFVWPLPAMLAHWPFNFKVTQKNKMFKTTKKTRQI
jgi:hypothetical protein